MATDHSIDVRIDGDGPDLVLVHSLLTDASAYDLVAPALAERHRVIRVALPGYGSTAPLDADAPTIYDLGDVVARALDVAAASPDAAVLGNGLGSFVCVAFAARHGDRFGPLICANGGAFFNEQRRDAFTTMADLVEADGMDAVVDVAVRRIFPEAYLDAHPEVIAERRAVLVRTDPGAFAAACRALRDMDLRPDLAGIANRTLIITGGADLTTPADMATDLVDGIEGAQLVELEGCGHCPPLEQPDAFASALTTFLAA